MKFIHLADCHLGAWKEPKMRELNEKSFSYAINTCIAEKVDFVLIAGDLFNTAFPPIDSMKLCAEKLKQLKDNNIPVYAIAGSHDSSASGKTIIDVLESAGLLTNVATGTTEGNKLKLFFTTDKKTGTKITGIPGKRGSLDKEHYKQLDFEHLENEKGEKIFLFHAALDELKQTGFEKITAMSTSLLPKNFNYYAGGHVHIIHTANLESRNNIVYPGPVFPNSFSEIEKLKTGSFCIVDNWNIQHKKIELQPVVSIILDCTGKKPAEITQTLKQQIDKHEIKNAVITIRLQGKITEGKTSDIDFKTIMNHIKQKDAYFAMKNSAGLTTTEFESNIITTTSADIEDTV
ncbi:DNA repair exonuclease, partial [Candidatus Woesearchaeota archaeon]|nr:DNA repair exonuclease [Candidatus Woesearchaeota archaeon]